MVAWSAAKFKLHDVAWWAQFAKTVVSSSFSCDTTGERQGREQRAPGRNSDHRKDSTLHSSRRGGDVITAGQEKRPSSVPPSKNFTVAHRNFICGASSEQAQSAATLLWAFGTFAGHHEADVLEMPFLRPVFEKFGNRVFFPVEKETSPAISTSRGGNYEKGDDKQPAPQWRPTTPVCKPLDAVQCIWAAAKMKLLLPARVRTNINFLRSFLPAQSLTFAEAATLLHSCASLNWKPSTFWGCEDEPVADHKQKQWQLRSPQTTYQHSGGTLSVTSARGMQSEQRDENKKDFYILRALQHFCKLKQDRDAIARMISNNPDTLGSNCSMNNSSIVLLLWASAVFADVASASALVQRLGVEVMQNKTTFRRGRSWILTPDSWEARALQASLLWLRSELTTLPSMRGDSEGEKNSVVEVAPKDQEHDHKTPNVLRTIDTLLTEVQYTPPVAPTVSLLHQKVHKVLQEQVLRQVFSSGVGTDSSKKDDRAKELSGGENDDHDVVSSSSSGSTVTNCSAGVLSSISGFSTNAKPAIVDTQSCSQRRSTTYCSVVPEFSVPGLPWTKIDLALPQLKIAIEVNGPGHYLFPVEEDGTVSNCGLEDDGQADGARRKQQDQHREEKHELRHLPRSSSLVSRRHAVTTGSSAFRTRCLESLGWTVAEIHFADWKQAERTGTEAAFLRETLKHAVTRKGKK
ncbi:unnamed protein product [Amoebophrya sp. A120]|nr:unnamed protein product [Amoebophrya sp. A120]|eukprot:GSA120T00012613001.1